MAREGRKGSNPLTQSGYVLKQAWWPIGMGFYVFMHRSSWGKENKFNGEELILNTKKTPITDKISRITVNIKYLVFLESINIYIRYT